MTTDYNALLKTAYLELNTLRRKLDTLSSANHEPLAIVGMACRFPGAPNPAAFWDMLIQGENPLREIPQERWDNSPYYEANITETGKNNAKFASLIDNAYHFDASFFGISPREALRLDPQQRLMLEMAWEALEHAGYDPLKMSGSATGVFVGVGNSDYNVLQVQPRQEIDAYVGTGSSRGLNANRISYVLNLRGPSMVIDTACSSSLVALDIAAKMLRTGEIDTALVGGVNLILTPDLSITFSQAQMLSADGRSKAFDASADGYGRGEGAGMLVLKRLSAAQAANDPIWAVVRGTAINQDGRSNGLTAPNGVAQEKVIRQALKEAQLTPADVDYVEAHGTGTPLGDPIEMIAIGNVYGAGHSKEEPIYVGSVKSNIGHLEAAAGVAGLIKVILALHHGVIPPHLHFKSPSPYIPWQKLPVAIPTEKTPWLENRAVHRAGVSSFGFGGTNAHIILETAPVSEAVSPQETPAQLVLKLSARDDHALHALAASYITALETVNSLNDLVYTANLRRADFDKRLAVVGANATELRDKLAQFVKTGASSHGVWPSPKNASNPDVVFLFTGQGAQAANMARELYEQAPIFKNTLDEVAELLNPYLPKPLFAVLFPEEADANLINETLYTQPALFAVEYALATLWMAWGVKPAAVTGHSVGEIVAACIAGVFSLEDALKLVTARARLMQALPQNGGMVAVFAGAEQLNALIAPFSAEVSIAAINTPAETVLSGESQALEKIVGLLKAKNINYRELTVSHAFHSPLMQPMLAEFRAVAASIRYNEPTLPYISNLTGAFVEADTVTSPDYWVEHVRGTVRFADGLQTLYNAAYRVFLEIGPRPILVGMGQRSINQNDAVWIPSLRPPRSDMLLMMDAVAALYAHGANIQWEELYQGQAIVLPTYPFQREEFRWIEAEAPQASPRRNGVVPASAPKREVNLDTDNDFVQQLVNAPSNRRRALLLDYLRNELANVLRMSPENISPQARFFDLGMDSLMALELKNRVQKQLGLNLSVTLAFDYPTIGKLSDYLLQESLGLTAATAKGQAKAHSTDEPIAIVGMGCRFPGGANDPQSYWDLLLQGFDAISPVPADRWDMEAYYDENPEAVGKIYTRNGGFLNTPIDQFDPLFFGISPREAASMDPQQRILLEVTWQALEHAGLAPAKLEGSATGVFIGINTNDYQQLIAASGLDTIDASMATGNTFSAAAGRISYVLGLQGPSLAVDTACSSSLVSLHLACQSLRSGESDLALAGGVNLMLSPLTTVAMAKLRALSPDGTCKTFDASADGYGRGEGAGIIVLKRLSDAIEANDTILALVRGSAVNQDGASGGLTVPNGPAQQAVIQSALASGNIDPDSIDYVEAHGTGTALGDPIEINTLTNAYPRKADNPLIVGSVKSNIGHLEAAAGIAGIIKLVLSLQNQMIPPHLHFKQPNPNIAWDELAVTIPTQAMPMPASKRPHLAAVSSFGFSGTNAHVILEESPKPVPNAASVVRPKQILSISARTEKAVQALAQSYSDFLRKNPSIALADMSHTANAGRATFAYRTTLIADNLSQLQEKLAAPLSIKRAERNLPALTTFFGDASPNDVLVARQLYDTSPLFHQILDKCFNLLQGTLEDATIKALFKADASENPYATLVSFMSQYSMAQLWASWGIQVEAVAGIGLGELTAAVIAEVLSLEDALLLLALCCQENMEALGEKLPRVSFSAPILPLASANRGHFITDTIADDLTKVDYWENIPAARIPETLISLSESGIKQILGIGALHLPATDLAYLPSLHSTADVWGEILSSLSALYQQGHAIDWAAFDEGYRVQKQVLPSYPFERQRHWFESIGTVKKAVVNQGYAAHSELGTRLRTALKQTIYERAVSSKDHSVQLYEQAYLNLGAYVQMALALLQENGLAGAISQLELCDWLALADVSQIVQTIQSTWNEQSASFDIAAFDAETDNWRLLAQGQLQKSASAYQIPALAELQAQVSSPSNFTLLNDLHWEGLNPAQTYVAEGQWLASLNSENSNRLAAFMSFALASAAATFAQTPDTLLLPNFVGELSAFATIPTTVWAHVQADGAGLSLNLYAENAEPFLTAQNIQVAPLPSHLLRSAAWSSVSQWFHEIEWQAAEAVSPKLKTGDTWLVFANDDAFSQNFVASIRAQGKNCLVVTAGTTNAAISAEHWQIQAGNREQIQALLQEIIQIQPLQEVIYLWGLATESLSLDSLIQFQTAQADSALALMNFVPAPARLWVISQGVQPVANYPVQATGLAQSMLWGLGRVASLEYPETWGGLIDLPELDSSYNNSLIAEIEAHSGEDQIVYRDGQRYLARLMQRQNYAMPSQNLSLQPDKAYLITGGLGKLGLKVAQYLVQNGAQTLVLTSRRGLPPRSEWQNASEESQATIAEVRALEALGAKVHIFAADVANEAQMTALFAQFNANLPALAGIVHASGVLRSEFLHEIDSAALQAVLAPKVQGTWLLHTLSADLELDFFLQFSSAAATWGSAKAGHYVAANHFQDIFVHYRHSLGLPAQVINWGWWENGGMVSADEQAYFAAIGLKTMPTSAALTALDYVLQSQTSQITVAPVDWNLYKPVFEARRARPFLASIVVNTLAQSGEVSAEGQALINALGEALPQERHELVLVYLNQAIRKVLRLDANFPIDAEIGFFEMGMDSLTSMELKNALDKQLGLQLPSTIAFEYPSPFALAQYLLDNLKPTENKQSSAEQDAVMSDTSLDDLSEDDLLALLENELK